MIDALRHPGVDLESFATALATGLTAAERSVFGSRLSEE